MSTQNPMKKLHHFWKHHGAPVFVILAVFCVVRATTDEASALYILTGTEDAAIVLDESAQVQDFSSQLVYLSTSSTGYDVTWRRIKKSPSPTTVRQSLASLSGRASRIFSAG